MNNHWGSVHIDDLAIDDLAIGDLAIDDLFISTIWQSTFCQYRPYGHRQNCINDLSTSKKYLFYIFKPFLVTTEKESIKLKIVFPLCCIYVTTIPNNFNLKVIANM